MPPNGFKIPKSVYGFNIRDPFDSELKFFKDNLHVGGMAAEDGQIILNPYSKLTDEEKLAVAKNEAARLYMRGKPFNLPDPTLQQFNSFAPTEYGKGGLYNLKQTLLARLISGDPSAGKPSKEQIDWASFLSTALNAREQK